MISRLLQQLCLVVLTAAVSPSVMGQTWERPENCAPLATDEATLRARLTIMSGVHANCTASPCKDMKVKIVVDAATKTCTASVSVGVLHVRPPHNGNHRAMKWIFDSSGPCTSGSQCRFDQPSAGITVGVDTSGQLPSVSCNNQNCMASHHNSAPSGALVSYEPHVFRKLADGNWQSCCPIDPKMIND